jgi:hypothetical protein
MRSSLVPIAVCLAAFALAAAGQAPAGFRTHSDTDSGLSFHYPVEFEEIPLPPTESVAKARYVRKAVPDALKDERIAQKPSFEVFILPKSERRTPGTTPRTAGGAESRPESRPESGPESGPASRAAHRSVREAFEQENRIEGFDEFRKKKLGGWDLKPLGTPTGPIREYALAPAGFVPPKELKAWPVGYLWIKDEGDVYVGVHGRGMSPIEKQLQVELRKVARSIVIKEPGEVAGGAARSYAGSKLPNVAFRVGVREALAKGWKAVDTENFIIVHHSDNEKLVNKIARDLEAVRPVYVEMFPPVKAIEAVAIVRVCKNREEYLAYGGHPSSGGYWHPGNEELVFYDYSRSELEAERKKGRRLTDKDSFVVLYHEAFHQYIHYAVGQIAPHDWFNEGHGDYFSGAVIPDYGTRVKSIGPSRWRITRAKREIDPDSAPRGSPPAGPWIPMEKVLNAKRPEYYNPATQSNYYVGGWALVYFLREAPEARGHPKWGRILGTYFEKLKEQYRIRRLGPADDADAARDAALRAALEGVDVHELDAAVKRFVQKMRHPWPEDLDL